MKTVSDIIIETRRRALRHVTLAPTRIYDIRKDYKTGKLIIKPKERVMPALRNTNYLQYDTRSVT
jgi:hypothetical protein